MAGHSYKKTERLEIKVQGFSGVRYRVTETSSQLLR